jgi:molybdopterin synthase catalytic subunit
MKRSGIVTAAIDEAGIIEEVRSDSHGAISLFVGTVRDLNEGREVRRIEYSVYKAMAEEELERILTEAEMRFGAPDIVVEHRVGFLALGETSVVIAAAHAHRGPALECTRYIIEEIKKRVPIWKMEHYSDGSREWVDPTGRAQQQQQQQVAAE